MLIQNVNNNNDSKEKMETSDSECVVIINLYILRDKQIDVQANGAMVITARCSFKTTKYKKTPLWTYTEYEIFILIIQPADNDELIDDLLHQI